jgi:hypothetical protein
MTICIDSFVVQSPRSGAFASGNYNFFLRPPLRVQDGLIILYSGVVNISNLAAALELPLWLYHGLHEVYEVSGCPRRFEVRKTRRATRSTKPSTGSRFLGRVRGSRDSLIDRCSSQARDDAGEELRS